MSKSIGNAPWVAIDWGTSNLRGWVFDAQDRPVAALVSDQGMNNLESPAAFEAALHALLRAHLPEHGAAALPVLCCGMVGARQGWVEAPYVATPCAVPTLAQSVQPAGCDARLDVRIVPGVMQRTPADVMRGEETQIGGFLAGCPAFDGVLCLPGTHSKWVHISAQEIVSFRSFMTGELFALLSGASVLRFSVGGSAADRGWALPAFAQAVADAMAAPQSFAAQLFALRAATLLTSCTPQETRARLSGLLIGLELAGARPYWLGREVVLIGDSAVAAPYEAALRLQGAQPRRFDGETAVIEGLRAARQQPGAAL
ncbi:MAG: 2-dehydro-3-deoxygalactonokinase [Rhodobacteraceae bacterium]|nr:2-dehydro-3-deoxygalactonokinase [Paracoccaceae bacterium]